MTTADSKPPKRVRVPPHEMARRTAIREALDQQGISIASWAKANNFNQQIVRGVLDGTFSGNRGEARAVCIALKLKTGEMGNPASFNPEAALRQLAAAA